MTRLLLSRALRRALILSLALPALAGQASCGGNVVVDGSATATGGATGTGGGPATGCVLLSSTPTLQQQACLADYPLVGTPADCGVTSGGALSTAECLALCPLSIGMKPAQSCTVTDQSAGLPGGASLECLYLICGTGRRPAGLVPAGDEGPDPVARFLGQVAHLEAAAVVAFDQLAAELEAHEAPAALVRGARRSARDEVRHARVTRRFAEQARAHPEPVAVADAGPTRTLEAIAVDNAVEGCVRETFGALVAMRQAEAARDPELRRAMVTIARDETRHAELSWALARWMDQKLDAAARARVRHERDRAVEGLLAELSTEPHPSLVVELGLPTAVQARAAAEDLRASLWA